MLCYSAPLKVNSGYAQRDLTAARTATSHSCPTPAPAISGSSFATLSIESDTKSSALVEIESNVRASRTGCGDAALARRLQRDTKDLEPHMTFNLMESRYTRLGAYKASVLPASSRSNASRPCRTVSTSTRFGSTR